MDSGNSQEQGKSLPLVSTTGLINCPGPELEFVNFLKSPGIDSQPLLTCATTLFNVRARQATKAGEIDSWAPETFTTSGSGAGERRDYCPLNPDPRYGGHKNLLTIYSHNTIRGQI
jgi:hypothetical protein